MKRPELNKNYQSGAAKRMKKEDTPCTQTQVL